MLLDPKIRHSLFATLFPRKKLQRPIQDDKRKKKKLVKAATGRLGLKIDKAKKVAYPLPKSPSIFLPNKPHLKSLAPLLGGYVCLS